MNQTHVSAHAAISPGTMVSIENELLGTVRRYNSPQSIKACLRNNLEVARAVHFCEVMEKYAEWQLPTPALRCAIQHGNGAIRIRWFVDSPADTKSALDDFARVLKGQEPEGEAV